jgi:hypothetical protein
MEEVVRKIVMINMTYIFVLDGQKIKIEKTNGTDNDMSYRFSSWSVVSLSLFFPLID